MPFEAIHRDGSISPYYVSSRAKKIEDLKAVSHHNKPDGVILYGVYGESKDRVVLIRQYRYPLGSYVYEFPAGLVEEVGRLDAPGHPILYGTTPVFLRTFGLASTEELENLPELEEIRRMIEKFGED